MKTAIVITLYAFALLLIYAGLHLAPNMTWPHTDLEWVAAEMLVAGMVAKLVGHVVLLKP